MMANRILIADDEPAITELVRRVLEVADYVVIEAHDGQEALDLVRRERPDLAILDVMMPSMDGREVTRMIKRDPALADTRVVLISSMDERDVNWKQAGADDFLQKVIDVLALPDYVERLLDGRGRR